MKQPLPYQVSEYDCAPVAFSSAFSMLLESSEVPVAAIRAMYRNVLDGDGTSREATRRLVDAVNFTGTRLRLEYYDAVDETVVAAALARSGVLVCRSRLKDEHYVVVVGQDESDVYLWDPYYATPEQLDAYEDVRYVDEPFVTNRAVSKERFYSGEAVDYSLGPRAKREAVGVYDA